MTDKTRTTVYLAQDNVDWMDAQSINRSDLINKLIRRYREGGRDMNAVLATFEKERIKSEMEQTRAKLETLEQQFDRVDDTVKSPEEARKEELRNTFADMQGIPADTDNMAVQNQAESHDMKPREFADKLQQWRQDNA